jgi:hypothetical protein
MFRQILITSLMAILMAGAAATGTSFPVLLLMAGLLLVALAQSSARDGRDKQEK